jgi:hypothetical protein
MEFHCRTWIPVFLVTLYKLKSCVAKVWHVYVKEPLLLKAIGAKHGPKFAALLLGMVTTAKMNNKLHKFKHICLVAVTYCFLQSKLQWAWEHTIITKMGKAFPIKIKESVSRNLIQHLREATWLPMHSRRKGTSTILQVFIFLRPQKDFVVCSKWNAFIKLSMSHKKPFLNF